MEKIKFMFKSLTLFERLLWSISLLVITVSFVLLGSGDVLNFIASLIGVTSLVFVAKGYPVGQLLMVIFSLLYGIISVKFRYYGEIITYLGMTAPMSFATFVSWIKHPYKQGTPEVKVSQMNVKKGILLGALTIGVTVLFYFILRYLNNANLAVSTLSIATSFAACGLMLFRSPYYALIYAANDFVLIVLWVMASISDISYIQVAICFCVFLCNDIYGFISWSKIKKKQHNTIKTECGG